MTEVRVLRAIGDIAVAFKARRLEREIRQEQLASVIGLGRSTIAKIETAANDPRISTVIKVAEALGFRVTLVPLAVSHYLENFGLPVGHTAALVSRDLDEETDLTDAWHGDGL